MGEVWGATEKGEERPARKSPEHHKLGSAQLWGETAEAQGDVRREWKLCLELLKPSVLLSREHPRGRYSTDPRADRTRRAESKRGIKDQRRPTGSRGAKGRRGPSQNQIRARGTHPWSTRGYEIRGCGQVPVSDRALRWERANHTNKKERVISFEQPKVIEVTVKIERIS